MPDQNIFPLPLYHGTSDLFIENIAKYGLNGYNQIAQYNLLPIMKQQVLLIEKHLSLSTSWIKIKDSTQKMIAQDGNIWSHGKTFLTCSKETAIRYATSNPYGSELLTRCFQLQNLLTEKNVLNYSLENQFRERGLHEIMKKKVAPIIISLNNIEIEKIIPVGDYSCIEEAVLKIKEVINQFHNDYKLIITVLQQTNFIVKDNYKIEKFGYEQVA